MHCLAARVVEMIRIDAVWLATEPMDMRAGMATALARVVKIFGAAHPHQAYLFANRRANRMKVLVHDGIGIWLAARRLHQGNFLWPVVKAAAQPSLMRWCSGCRGSASVRAASSRWFDWALEQPRRSIGASAHSRQKPARAHSCAWLSPLNYWQTSTLKNYAIWSRN